MTSPREAMARVRRRLERDPNVTFALVFGSHGEGTACGGSDLDVGVHFTDPPAGLAHLDLLSELSDAAGDEVDLVVLNRASALLRHQVLLHRHPLFVRDRRAYVAFREQAMADYDTYRYLAGGRACD